MKSPTEKIKVVSFVLKPDNIIDFENLLPNLCLWLLKRHKKIQFLNKEKDRLVNYFQNSKFHDYTLIERKDLFGSSDLIITLGGDGTLLSLGRSSDKSKTPVFSVNLGKLGFVTEFSKNEFFDELSNFFAAKLKTINFPLFSVSILQNNKTKLKEYFLNDAVINKQDISRMFTLSVHTENEKIYDISGDGLIISTPIGSTAYSLAAGGPIVHPEVKALILSPICPHSLTFRPLVLPDDISLSIKVTNRADNVILTFDGQQAVPLTADDVIIIKKESRKVLTLVKNPSRTYFQTLKIKLFHGRREAN